jgi:pyrimidine-nucleoside phosphorylase
VRARSGPVRGDVDPRWVIARKRDGGELSPETIEAFLRGFLAGRIRDYQMSAFLMAALLRGMTAAETLALARAMLQSGRRLAWHHRGGPLVDKHSTGGVGDKVSLILAPLLVATGLRVPMISGRGLGHTGGTLDKLQSSPGNRVELSENPMARMLEKAGMFIAGQTESLVPADRKLYALRDVTATVESPPLIVSSILSKKAAAGLECLVLDVKFGDGAFMDSLPPARSLARSLVATAHRMGLRAVAVLTRMDGVLGRTAGNALEVDEAVRMLAGDETPSDLLELVEVLGGTLLVLSGKARALRPGRQRIRRALRDGSGLAAFTRWISAQGGPADPVRLCNALPRSRERTLVPAPATGYVSRIDGKGLGLLLGRLGGGRLKVGDTVRHGVGARLLKRPGESVRAGEAVLELLHEARRGPRPADLESLVRVARRRPGRKPLIAGVVTRSGFYRDPEAAPLNG